MSTVTAMTDAVIVRLEKAAIVRLIHREPAFSEMFIAHLLGRTIRVEADLVDQLFNSSEKRLARMLLLLSLIHISELLQPPARFVGRQTARQIILCSCCRFGELRPWMYGEARHAPAA